MKVFILVFVLQGIVAYTLNLRESLSTMCMTTVPNPFFTSVLLVVFIIDSVRCSESSASLLTTKLKLKHVSDEPTSKVTNVSDEKVLVKFPKKRENERATILLDMLVRRYAMTIIELNQPGVIL